MPIVDSAEPAAAAGEALRVQALIDAARRGDREAFGELVALHERVVIRTAMAAALGRAEDAEDAAQEAFLVAWRKLPGFRGESTFRTWLLTIAWRKALDRRRVRRLWWARSQPSARDADDTVLGRLAAAVATPEQAALSRDLARRIKSEIERLSPRLKDAFVLAMTGEDRYDEIGALLRIPVGTVKWRVAEARRMIRNRLGV